MRVILKQDISTLGRAGDIKEVRDGYARNYLFPQSLAYEATEANVRKLAEQKKKYDEKMLHEKTGAESVAKQIEGMTVVIAKKAGEGDVRYGPVTPTEIADALAARGVEVDRRRIELAEPIKRLGEHRVHVRLHRDVATELIVDVQPLAPVTV